MGACKSKQIAATDEKSAKEDEETGTLKEHNSAEGEGEDADKKKKRKKKVSLSCV